MGNKAYWWFYIDCFLLCCDDTIRENGNIEKAEKMAKSCEENGFTAISMNNDWKTIYGENVTRK